MPKNVKISKTRHISGYDLPTITKKDWLILEEAADLKFSKSSRADLLDAIRTYVETTLSHQNGSERLNFLSQKHAKSKVIQDLAKSMDKFSSNWTAASQNLTSFSLLSEFDADLRSKTKGALNYIHVMDQIETLRLSLHLFLEDIKNKPVAVKNRTGKTGKYTSSNPMEVLVRDLAKTFKAAGGQISKTKSTGSLKFTLPRFHRFLKCILSLLPAEYQIPWNSDEAMAAAVQRALKPINI